VIFPEATVTKNPAQMRAACQWLGLAIHKYGVTVANGGAGTFLGGNPPAAEFEIEIAGNARFRVTVTSIDADTPAPSPAADDVLAQVRNLLDAIKARRGGDLANGHRSAVAALAELRAIR
jgi:hypothetical protein